MSDKIPCNTHELKILPKWFEDVQANRKNFEIRRADRNFKVGDKLLLKEYDRGKYTGRKVIREIEYIYKGDGTFGLSEDFWILGLKIPPAVIKTVTNAEEAKTYPISKDISKGFEEFTRMMFKQGQAESEDKE